MFDLQEKNFQSWPYKRKKIKRRQISGFPGKMDGVGAKKQ